MARDKPDLLNQSSAHTDPTDRLCDRFQASPAGLQPPRSSGIAVEAPAIPARRPPGLCCSKAISLVQPKMRPISGMQGQRAGTIMDDAQDEMSRSSNRGGHVPARRQGQYVRVQGAPMPPGYHKDHRHGANVTPAGCLAHPCPHRLPMPRFAPTAVDLRSTAVGPSMTSLATSQRYEHCAVKG